MAVEGEIVVGVTLAGGRIDGVRVASSRPDIGRSLLRGRKADAITQAVPLLFSLCGRSQGIAARLACGAAIGARADAETIAAARRVVADETIGEHARCLLLQAPAAQGEPPDARSVDAARRALAFDVSAPDADDAAQAIADAVYGMPAARWLELDGLAALRSWAAARATAVARHAAALLALPAARRPPSGALLIGAGPQGRWVAEWALAEAGDATAAAQQPPTWFGTPAETGALARMQRDPVVAAALAAHASRAPARAIARLRELAQLLSGAALPAVGVRQLPLDVPTGALPSDGAVAWVENARGLLLHRARFDRDHRAVDYRIVAPTDWNFHPRGALAAALEGLVVGDAAAAEHAVADELRSLDPCVGWRIEVVQQEAADA